MALMGNSFLVCFFFFILFFCFYCLRSLYNSQTNSTAKQGCGGDNSNRGRLRLLRRIINLRRRKKIGLGSYLITQRIVNTHAQEAGASEACSPVLFLATHNLVVDKQCDYQEKSRVIMKTPYKKFVS